MNRKIIIANWKMSVNRADTTRLTRAAGVALGKCGGQADVILASPYVYLTHVSAILPPGITLAAQDVAVPHHPKGAQTGDVSPEMLRDIGCAAVIIGHSERRAGHGEVNDTIRAKVAAARASGLTVILCVGETADEHAAGRGRHVVSDQIHAALFDQPNMGPDSVMVAYEPIWAISGGGGQAATPEDVASMHQFLANYIETTLAPFQGMRLLYGGSVRPDNASVILSLPHVDGVLVGGASLDADALSEIIRAGCAASRP